MKTYFQKKFISPLAVFLKSSLPSCLLILFFLLLGISAGACAEVFLDDETKKGLFSFLAKGWGSGALPSSELVQVFWSSCIQNLGLLLLITISGLTVVGFPLVLLAIAYKGASLGFASALLMDALGRRGAFLAAFSLLPSNFFILPALVISAALSINLSTSIIRSRPEQIRNCLQTNAGNYIVFQLILSLFLIIGCFADAFICPFLQQLLI